MTLARLKRIPALERCQPTAAPWRDPFDAAMALWMDLEAVAADRACWLTAPEPEFSPETEHLFELAMRDADRMAARLRSDRA